MVRLLTRCISEDYQKVTDNHEVIDRGELGLSDLQDALHNASYMMPHSSDPESPHRPAVGVVLANELTPTFFYASDYQGSFSLKPVDSSDFQVIDILNLIQGQITVKEVQENKIASAKSFTRGTYLVLGTIFLIVLYFACAPIFGW